MRYETMRRKEHRHKSVMQLIRALVSIEKQVRLLENELIDRRAYQKKLETMEWFKDNRHEMDKWYKRYINETADFDFK